MLARIDSIPQRRVVLAAAAAVGCGCGTPVARAARALFYTVSLVPWLTKWLPLFPWPRGITIRRARLGSPSGLIVAGVSTTPPAAAATALPLRLYHLSLAGALTASIWDMFCIYVTSGLTARPAPVSVAG